MNVIKRSGKIDKFDKSKIVKAIMKAFVETYSDELPDDAVGLCDKIASEVESRGTDMRVEEIQDIVVKKLMGSKYKDVATQYVEYRYLHEMARNRYDELMNAVADKLQAKNVQNQNANVDEHSFGGRIGEASDVVNKQYALEFIVSKMARDNHINNEVYIHDLSSYAIGNHNCMTLPLDDLLANGFNTRQTDVRPAQSINTAMQLVAVLMQLQSLQQFGGVAAGHLDWTMIPYVRKSFYKHYKDGLAYIEKRDTEELECNNITNDTSIDSDAYKTFPDAYKYAMDMTVRECYQAVEGMYHNLNCIRAA